MADETRNGDSKVRVVRLLGHRDDAGAWEIRDFLKRSVVESQWIELSTEEDCRRELGEDKLLGRGLYYGAGASEAPLCGGEDVYVVGGGNSAGQAVMHLARHARSVTMLWRATACARSISQYLAERILGAANVQVRYDAEITGLDGDKALERIRIGS